MENNGELTEAACLLFFYVYRLVSHAVYRLVYCLVYRRFDIVCSYR